MVKAGSPNRSSERGKTKSKRQPVSIGRQITILFGVFLLMFAVVLVAFGGGAIWVTGIFWQHPFVGASAGYEESGHIFNEYFAQASILEKDYSKKHKKLDDTRSKLVESAATADATRLKQIRTKFVGANQQVERLAADQIAKQQILADKYQEELEKEKQAAADRAGWRATVASVARVADLGTGFDGTKDVLQKYRNAYKELKTEGLQEQRQFVAARLQWMADLEKAGSDQEKRKTLETEDAMLTKEAVEKTDKLDAKEKTLALKYWKLMKEKRNDALEEQGWGLSIVSSVAIGLLAIIFGVLGFLLMRRPSSQPDKPAQAAAE